jgi:hypothetical protein
MKGEIWQIQIMAASRAVMQQLAKLHERVGKIHTVVARATKIGNFYSKDSRFGCLLNFCEQR